MTLFLADACLCPTLLRRVSPCRTPQVVDPYGGSMPPLWQTATFAQPSATTFGEYDYTRSGNPTRTMLEVGGAGEGRAV